MNNKKRIVRDSIIALVCAVVGYIWYYVTNYSPNGIEPLIGSFWALLVAITLKLLIWHYRTSTNVEAIDTLKTESNNEVIGIIIISLRKRSKKLLFAAQTTLVLIFLTLISGALIFVYADSIAQRSEYQNNRYYSEWLIKNMVDNTKNMSDDAIDSMLNLEDVTLLTMPEGADEDEISEIKKRIPRFVKEKLFDPLSKKLSSELELEFAKLKDASQGKGLNSSVISAMTTRIGSVFMLLFLVQILVSLYRYSTRLASFYDGRADALQLSSNLDNLDFETLVNLTSPDNLDFSKSQKSPADQAIELTKHLLDKGQK